MFEYLFIFLLTCNLSPRWMVNAHLFNWMAYLEKLYLDYTKIVEFSVSCFGIFFFGKFEKFWENRKAEWKERGKNREACRSIFKYLQFFFFEYCGYFGFDKFVEFSVR